MQKLARDYLNELNKRHKKNRRALAAWILMAVLVVGGVLGTLAQYGFAEEETPAAVETTAAPEIQEETPAPADTTTAAPESQEETPAPADTTTAAAESREETPAPADTTSAPEGQEETPAPADTTTAAPENPDETTEGSGEGLEETTAPEETSEEALTAEAAETETGTETETETETATEESTEEEILSPAFSQKYEDGQVTVYVKAAEGVIPAGAKLVVKPVVEQDLEALKADRNVSDEEVAEAEALNAKYEDVRKELESTVEKDETKEISGFLAYDISFVVADEDGVETEVEPKGDVSVTMRFTKAQIPEKIETDDTLQVGSVDVVHMKETEKGLQAEVLPEAEVGMTEDNKVKTAGFVSDSFSTYVVTWVGDIDLDGRYSYEDDDIVIKISPEDEGAIPADARVGVIPILPEEKTAAQYELISELLKEKAEQEEYEIAGFLAYDISLVDGEGEELEPDGRVRVTMDYREVVTPERMSEAVYASEEGTGDKAVTEGTTDNAEEETADTAETETAELSTSVLHFEEDANGEIVRIVDLTESEDATVKVTEKNEITGAEFVTDGFSPFMLSSKKPGESGQADDEGEVDVPDTQIVPSMMEKHEDLLSEKANEWQIVDQQYEDNTEDHKIPGQENPDEKDPYVLLQKNVIPTDTENEFLVYLSVDMKSVFENYLRKMKYLATTSKNGQSGELFSKHKIEGTGDLTVSTVPSDDLPRSCVLTICSKKTGEVLIPELTVYWGGNEKATNATIFVDMGDDPDTPGNKLFIRLLVGLKEDLKNATIYLEEDAENLLRQKMETELTLGTLTDTMGTMGEYIEYQGIVDSNGVDVKQEPGKDENGNPDSNNRNLVLELRPRSNAPTETIEGANGEKITWSRNICEALYRVKLDVTKAGFNSCAAANIPGDKFPEGGKPDDYPWNYEVNESAKLAYTKITKTTTAEGTPQEKTTYTEEDATATFPKPYVRGLLYDFTFVKRAMNENETEDLGPLEGAKFEVTKTTEKEEVVQRFETVLGNEVTEEQMYQWSKDTGDMAVASVGINGAVQIVGLPWGTYTVTETEAPAGCDLLENLVVVDHLNLCYTDYYKKYQEYLQKKETDETVSPPIPVYQANTDNKKSDADGRVVSVDVIHEDYKLPEIAKDWTITQINERYKNVVYNVQKFTSVTVVKDWIDGNASTRPTGITVQLYYLKNGELILYKDQNDHKNGYELVLNTDNKWQGTFDKLPLGLEYHVVELPLEGETLEGYTLLAPQIVISNNKTTITITNVLKSQIIKRSASDNTKYLNGAEFTLTEDREGGKTVLIGSAEDETGVVKWYEVDENGNKTESVGSLEELTGSYILTETKAPEGYMLSTAAWTITIGENHYVEITDENGKPIPVTNADSTGIQTFYFDNELAYELPSTGGRGIYRYMISGVLLMMAGVLILYKNKRVRGC